VVRASRVADGAETQRNVEMENTFFWINATNVKFAMSRRIFSGDKKYVN